MAEGGGHNSSQEMEQESYLAPEHVGVTILALRMSNRRKLGMYLNLDAMPLPCGLLPNYQGLAELIGFEFIEQRNFERARDPTDCMFQEWCNRPEFQPTLGKLVEYLIKLQREDVLEECKENIRLDAEHYLARKIKRAEIQPVQDSTVTQSPYDIDDMEVDETAIMTIQDVEKGEPTYYDAFVCYHPEGEDLKFVQTMIEKVECEPYNLRLFVPHRDDLPGASKHVISAKLIQDRCKRMVIVMSPRYLQSDACDFQTKFAHALSPGSRSKKLVPVLVTWCETPNILRHVTICDYTRGDMTGWFWQRLIGSLKAPLRSADILIDNPGSLSNLEMKVKSGATSFSKNNTSSVMSRSPQQPQKTQAIVDLHSSHSSPACRDGPESRSTNVSPKSLRTTRPVQESVSTVKPCSVGVGQSTSSTSVFAELHSASPSSEQKATSPSSEQKATSLSNEQKAKKKESGFRQFKSKLFGRPSKESDTE